MQLKIAATLRLCLFTIDMPEGSIGRGSRVRGGLTQYELHSSHLKGPIEIGATPTAVCMHSKCCRNLILLVSWPVVTRHRLSDRISVCPALFSPQKPLSVLSLFSTQKPRKITSVADSIDRVLGVKRFWESKNLPVSLWGISRSTDERDSPHESGRLCSGGQRRHVFAVEQVTVGLVTS